MEYAGIAVTFIVLIMLIIAFCGMWFMSTGKMNDYDLYGVDADEYLKKQVGDDYYNRNYK